MAEENCIEHFVMRLMLVLALTVVPIVLTCPDFCLIKCEIDSMDGLKYMYPSQSGFLFY